MVAVNIYETKIIVYDTLNSIVYYKFLAPKYQNYNRFKQRLELYLIYEQRPTYADIMTIAYENNVTAVCNR